MSKNKRHLFATPLPFIVQTEYSWLGRLGLGLPREVVVDFHVAGDDRIY